MPRVGRPSSRTNQGTSAPIRELGVPDLGMGGGVVGMQPSLVGGSGPWRMFIDEWEYVPELRWPLSVRLYDQMRTDSQLAGLLTAVMWGISQLRFVIDPNGANDTLVKEISEDLNLPIMGKDGQPIGRMKNRFSHSKFVTQALLATIYGHNWFEQVGEIVDGKWRLRKLAPRMPQTIRQINIAPDGGLVSIEQWAPVNWNGALKGSALGPTIPVDNLVGFIFQQEGMSWSGRSMMRDCYRDWLIKDRDLRIEAINHERAGGVPWAEGAQGMTVDELQSLDQMMRQFRIGEESGGALPFGAKLNIARGTGSDVDKTIKRIDESMARRFLLQLVNLAQGGQHVGSYALGQTFEDFFLVGQRHIAQWYCDTMTEHVIEDIVDWNYGDSEQLTPRITWERTSEDALGTEQLALLVQRGVITMDEELEDVVRYRNMLPKKTEPRPEVTPAGPKQPTLQQAQIEAQQTGSEPGTAPQAMPPSTRAAGLVSSLTGPADTQASFMQRLFRRKPEVMAAAPALVTVPNVPIMEAGIEYNLSTGATTFTPEDLADAVTAANEDPSIPNPRLWIGHIDPRYNDTSKYDATPAFATARNLRLSDNGMTIYGDYVGVPEWLAPILPTAYPSRSIEGFWNVESHAGKTWRFVISSCKVLGVTWPGINQLEDLPQYYGKEVPPGVVIDHEAIAAAQNRPGGDPMRVNASAHLDDIRRAFFREYVPGTDKTNWWIRAAMTDPNELIVEDDESGQLYRLPYSSDGNRKIHFGEAEPVRLGIIPDKPELMKAAASHVAATLAVGREVLASWTTRAESSPEQTGGGSMDPKEIRNRLGLPEDASDEQVRETIKAMNLPGVEITAEEPTAPTTPAPGEPAPGTPTPTPAPEPTPTAEPTAVAASNLPAGVVAIDEATLASLRAGAATALELKAGAEKNGREAAVAAAIGDGRIAPARKDYWLEYLEKDPGGIAVLASLEKGLVPVTERGHGHAPDTTASHVDLEADTVDSWTTTLFPEVRQTRAQDAAAAAGQPRRSRIVTDAHGSR